MVGRGPVVGGGAEHDGGQQDSGEEGQQPHGELALDQVGPVWERETHVVILSLWRRV